MTGVRCRVYRGVSVIQTPSLQAGAPRAISRRSRQSCTAIGGEGQPPPRGRWLAAAPASAGGSANSAPVPIAVSGDAR